MCARACQPARHTKNEKSGVVRMRSRLLKIPFIAPETRMRCTADFVDRSEPLHRKSHNKTRTSLREFRVSNLKEELNETSAKGEGIGQDIKEELTDTVQEQNQIDEADGRGARSQNLYKLPASLCPGSQQHSWVSGHFPEDLDPTDPSALLHWLQENSTRLQMIFLGTSSWCPTDTRNLPSLALRTTADVWLFDTGEDTQRQCMRHPLLRPGKVSRIFLTGLRGDAIFGLPGMLCTIATSRDQMAAHTDQPVHVYGPPGTGKFLASLLDLSETFLRMPVIIHEFSSKPPSRRLELLTRRAKLWKVDIPPDQLNKEGFYDAKLDSVLPVKRRLAKKGKRSNLLNTTDARAGFRPFDLPPPGDASLHPIPARAIQWTLMISEEFLVTVFQVDDVTESLGYRISEADRTGVFCVDRAKALGINPGKDFGVLKNGGSVKNSNGELITSEMVLGPDRPGRTLAVFGEISDVDRCRPVATGAHCIVLPVGKDATRQNGITPSEAVQFATDCSAPNLIFARHQTTDHESMTSIPSCLAETRVSVTSAFDLYTHVFAKH